MCFSHLQITQKFKTVNCSPREKGFGLGWETKGPLWVWLKAVTFEKFLLHMYKSWARDLANYTAHPKMPRFHGASERVPPHTTSDFLIDHRPGRTSISSSSDS